MTEFEDWIKSKEARRSKKDGRTRLKRNKAPKANRVPKPRRSKPRKHAKRTGFSEEVRQEAYNRFEGNCENPLCRQHRAGLGGEHHCLPRSAYKKRDRDNAWNCAGICSGCHHRITFPSTDDDIRLRRYFELVAVTRRDYTEEKLVSTLAELERSLIDGTLDLIRQYHTFTK